MLLDLEPADEEVAEAIRRGRWRKPEPLLEPVEDVALGRPDVEGAAEDEWPAGGEVQRSLGGGNKLRLGR